MGENFPTEKSQEKIDGKIKTAKAEIQTEFSNACEAHSSSRIVDLIKSKEDQLKNLRDQS